MDVFPPALVPVLRAHFASRTPCLAEVDDEVLEKLLNTVFFAGLETYEGERNTIRVLFLGKSPLDVLMPEDMEPESTPVYRWKSLGFETSRPFTIAELIKLAVASRDSRLYSAIHVQEDGRLAISGLVREGFDTDRDRFVKIIASRPGSLSIRSGRSRLLEYERGAILTGGEDVVFAAEPVRRALASTARAAGLEHEDIGDYLGAVHTLVREMEAQGRGGILIVHPEELPPVPESAAYRMVLGSSVASLLRLARRLGHAGEPAPPSRSTLRHVGRHLSLANATPAPDTAPFRSVLRNAFLNEAERIIDEIGALSAIDGATLLNQSLALVAFGLILPVGRSTPLVDGTHDEGSQCRTVDVGGWGTRHRAAATYATRHPGSVVFVASEDGQVTCMLREASRRRARLWQVGPADDQAA